MSDPVASTVDYRERLNSSRLPVLAPSAPYLLQTLSDNKLNIAKVAAVVERFPSVAMRLIALANSGWSSPASPIESLVDACARLGMDVVRTVSIALTVAAPFDLKRCPSFNAERYWSHAMLTAIAANAFAEQSAEQAPIDPQAAHTAGLLHSIGLVWITSQLPTEMHAILLLKEHEPELSLNGLLMDRLGVEYGTMGAHLGRTWGLPDAIVLPMAHHDDDTNQERLPSTVGIVRQASAMASLLLDGEDGPRQSVRLRRLSAGEREHIAQIQERVSARLSGVRSLAQEIFTHP